MNTGKQVLTEQIEQGMIDGIIEHDHIHEISTDKAVMKAGNKHIHIGIAGGSFIMSYLELNEIMQHLGDQQT